MAASPARMTPAPAMDLEWWWRCFNKWTWPWWEPKTASSCGSIEVLWWLGMLPSEIECIFFSFCGASDGVGLLVSEDLIWLCWCLPSFLPIEGSDVRGLWPLDGLWEGGFEDGAEKDWKMIWGWFVALVRLKRVFAKRKNKKRNLGIIVLDFWRCCTWGYGEVGYIACALYIEILQSCGLAEISYCWILTNNLFSIFFICFLWSCLRERRN